MNSLDNRNAPPNASRTKVSRNEVILRRILRNAPQDLWLDTIRRTRSDAHNGLIYWMLSQPECDFAIAVHAFYRSNPSFYLDNPTPLVLRPGPANIFSLVLVNWDTGYYRNHKLKVEATDVHPRIVERLQQKLLTYPRGTLPFTIPQELLQPAGGTSAYVAPNLSPDDASDLWPIYAEMGLRVAETAPGLKRRVARAKDFLKRVGLAS